MAGAIRIAARWLKLFVLAPALALGAAGQMNIVAPASPPRTNPTPSPGNPSRMAA